MLFKADHNSLHTLILHSDAKPYLCTKVRII